jgi:hypothetical protein
LLRSWLESWEVGGIGGEIVYRRAGIMEEIGRRKAEIWAVTDLLFISKF